MYKVIIFDFDGTLADTIQLGYETFQFVAEKYGFRKLENFAEYQELLTLPIIKILFRLKMSPWKVKKIIQENQQLGMEKFLACPPYPEVPSLIPKLAENYSLLIISSNLSTFIEQYLSHYHLLEYFEEVLGADVHHDKITKIKAAMKRYDVTPSEVLFIGDSVRDLRDGQKAGVPRVAVTYGLHTAAALKAENPEFMIHSLDELTEILARPN